MSNANAPLSALPTDSEQAILARADLPSDWKDALKDALLCERTQQLREFLRRQYAQGKCIYPPKDRIFYAFNRAPLSGVKVVIVGQDPYHGPGQATGLAFGVPKAIPKPPSLQNILKELATDTRTPPPGHGDLSHWADQGVLLLNSVLTVEKQKPASHQNQGWEEFTDAAIAAVNDRVDHAVFMLWGAYAKKKGRYIDDERHLILSAAHPSPLSANRGGFFGSRPFSRANAFLERHGKTPIDWRLP